MIDADKFTATADAWDSGKLGRDEKFVKRAEPSEGEALDRALDLQMISVRLQKELIRDLKFIATAHGIGYQPLMRDILSRFVVHEKKRIIQDVIERRRQEMELEKQSEEAMEKKQKKCA